MTKLPELFVSQSYDKLFLSVYAAAFANLLEKAAASAKDFETLHQQLNKHALLTVTLERKIKLPPITVELSGEKRTHEFKEELPFGFDHHRLHLNRQCLSSPDCLREWAAILAYMWAVKILPATESERVILLKCKPEDLAAALKHLHRGLSDAKQMSKLILGGIVENLIADSTEINSRIQALGRKTIA